jgi:hypothetical protein
VAIDTTDDSFPVMPPGTTPAVPTIAGQQNQRAAEQPRVPTTDDSFPAAPPSVLGTSFGKVPSDNSPGHLWDSFTHGLGLGTRDVMTGAGSSLPGMALDAISWPGRAAIRLMGGSATAPSDMPGKAADLAGLPTPQTDAERRKSEFIRGGTALLASALPGAVAGGAVEALPSIARPLVSTALPASAPAAAVQAVAGGTGAVAGPALASSELVPEWLKPTANLVGNIVGAGGINLAAGGIGQVANAFGGVQSALSAALERLGIPKLTMGAVTDSPGVKSTEATLSKIPTAMGVLQPKQQQMVDAFGNAIEDTARRAETGTNAMAPVHDTATKTGNTIQQKILDWKNDTLPTQEDAMWKPVNDAMNGKEVVDPNNWQSTIKLPPASTGVDPSGLRAALQRQASDVRLSNMPETAKQFASKKIQDLLDSLASDAPPGQKISWDTAQAYKQQIGNMLGKQELVSTLGQSSIRDLYGGLAGDMETAANNAGVGRQYAEANAFSSRMKTFQDETLSKAVSGKNQNLETVSPDEATEALLNGSSDDLTRLRANIPEAADALAAYKLRQLAQAKPSQQGAGDTTSTGTFLTGLRRSQLSNPEGTRALFADPQVSQNVNDLGTVAGQFRSVEKNMNTSGTTGAAALALALQHLMEAAVSGNTRQAASTVAGLAAPHLAARAMTSPLATWLASAQRAPAPAVPGLLGGAITSQVAPPQP